MTAQTSAAPHAPARLGGAAAMAGAVLALIGNVLHPRYTDLPDVEIYRRVALTRRLPLADTAILVAVVLIVAGLVTLTRVLQAHQGDLAAFARVAAVSGGTLALAGVAVELQALKQQAVNFRHATAQDYVAAFWATVSLDRLTGALFGVWTVVLLGVVPLLLGWALLRARLFPSWVAWLGLGGGAVCAAVGAVNLLSHDQGRTELPFAIGSVLVTLWFFAVGFHLWQRPEAGAAELSAPAEA